MITVQWGATPACGYHGEEMIRGLGDLNGLIR
jgi:hypothetical protein